MQTHPYPRHRGALLAAFLFALLPLSAALLSAAPLNPEKFAALDAAITNALAEKRMPGAVVWLEREEQTYHKAFGFRAVLPDREPMTEDTIFDAASLTKVIATTPALLILSERGKIDFDAPVSTYVPEFATNGKAAITVKQLMTHVSGLRAGLSRIPSWTGYDTAIRRACAEKPDPAPGTGFRYSDINFIMLGEVVRRASGKPLDEFVAQELYEPLKMVDTGFRPAAEKTGRIAPTERSDGKFLRGTVHDPTARLMGGVAGHAGLFTTAADLARYARMLVNGGELDGVRVLKPETVRLMARVHTPDAMAARRGLGWDIDTGYSRRGKLFPIGSYGHTGFTGTSLWIDPFSRTFIIFLSNRVHPEGGGNVLALQSNLGTLAAEAVEGFDFAQVPGALPARTNLAALASATNAPPAASGPEVLNGIDVLVKQGFAPLRKLRLGLITNHTGNDRRRRATIDLLKAAPEVELKALFAPEHGIRGELDEKVGDSVDEKTGLPVYSLYGARRAPAPEQLNGLEALVFDIQDIGCRFYTYSSTLGLCLEAAAKAKLKFFVLDRVNPINGVSVEGPLYTDAKREFIAFHRVPLRHGLTLGELAQMFNEECGFHADLTVIRLQGWRRDMWFDETGLPWTNPSPNMRSVPAAIMYPGLGLHETALSVGRGTEKPFEWVGAPYIDDVALAGQLAGAGVPGVGFVPVRFTPTYSTFKDKPCAGVALLLNDRARLRSVDLGIELALTLHRLYPNDFALNKLQTLLRDQPTMDAIKAGKTLAEIKKLWEPGLEEFAKRRERFLIYR